MGIDELMTTVNYVVDEEGKRTAVQLDLKVWENIVKLLRQSESEAVVGDEAAWDSFIHLLRSSRVDTGIPDLAAEHDHYLYGAPKRADS